MRKGIGDELRGFIPVSYTHLDVYKRQHLHGTQLIDADYAYTPGTEAHSNARQGSAVTPNAVQAVRLAAGVHPIRIGYVGHA